MLGIASFAIPETSERSAALPVLVWLTFAEEELFELLTFCPETPSALVPT
jgi:hypothetical protein